MLSIFSQILTTDSSFMSAIWSVFFEYCSDVYNINGLVQDCSNSIANALGLLQCCTTLSILCYSGSHDSSSILYLNLNMYSKTHDIPCDINSVIPNFMKEELYIYYPDVELSS